MSFLGSLVHYFLKHPHYHFKRGHSRPIKISTSLFCVDNEPTTVSTHPTFLLELPANQRTPNSLQRKVAIAVDLSEERAFAVRWAVQNYLRPGDSVVLLHVCPTSVLYGADWGSVDPNLPNDAVSSLEFISMTCNMMIIVKHPFGCISVLVMVQAKRNL
ncbi:unnamed protein product [Prunus armeniaca]|uniref:UspA domain-containing protein n=1 Tax=Prunus armeniaca TaxID=36596 RepID=A0A6J5WTJ2_PRUAR|nr:unnamed protein product [Prunus armeniaca]